MKPSYNGTCVGLCFCALILSLSACGASQAPPIQSVVTPPLPAQQLQMHSSRLLAYLSEENANRISVFRLNGRRIAAITDDVNYPQGLFADAHGTLYVANRGSNDVLEFKTGSDSPFRTLHDGNNQPEDVAVCPNGNVYVANILNGSGGGGNVTVYPQRSRKPAETLTYDGAEFFFLTCSLNGNVFATAVLGTTGTVIEFFGGQQSGAAQLPIYYPGNPAGIVAESNGDLLVAGQGSGVEEFTESGQPTGLQIQTSGLLGIALSPDGTLLLGASDGGGTQYSFPSGMFERNYHAHGLNIGAAFGVDGPN
ncbi:MAG: hypothetical protein JOZ77_12555 [Candidatus Eremiobacteraeota bacterium]|nr:hypothetical protein [Candidatus Eremiobacteraeota bacterium]